MKTINNNIVLRFNEDCLLHHKPIHSICINPHCSNPNILICQDRECLSLHANHSYEAISVSKLNNLIITNTTSMQSVNQRISQYFKQLKGAILYSIDKDSSLIEASFQYLNRHPIFEKLSQMKYNELNSKHMKQFMNYLEIESRAKLQNLKTKVVKAMNALDSNINFLRKQNSYINLLLQNHVAEISSHHSPKYQLIETNVINQQQFKFINQMILQSRKDITQWKLIYRASQHQFTAKSYHEEVAGYFPTLTIVKTKLGRKFGAFLNFKVQSNAQGSWIADSTCKSFLFSIDYNQKYKLKEDRKYYSKALYGGNQGLQVGCGCDLYIRDKCNQKKSNGSNLGGSYQLPPGLNFGQKKTKEYLAGEEQFYVQEYQVYHLI